MKVQIMKKIVLISSLSLFALACSEKVGDDAKEGSEPGQCEDGADNDGDGYYDCEDNDCFTSPACTGEVDTGDPVEDGDIDGDNDGFTPNEGDCDDDDKKIHPDADEKCNNVDDDCDGTKDNDPVDGDTYYEDWDSDGYGDANNPMEACDQPNGYVTNDDDCDDTSSLIRPGGNEISWNGIDEDCDGLDFNGLSCAEDAAEDALAYIAYYGWIVADDIGSYTLASWAITNQLLYVDYDAGKAVNVERDGEGSTELAISMDTFIQMNQSGNPFDLNFDILYGAYVEQCTGYVPWMPLKFEGEISIAVNGSSIDSTVSMSAAWDGLVQDDMVLDSACNLNTLAFIWDYLYAQGYIPYSNLLGFLDNSYQNTADALSDVVETTVKAFIDYECAQ
jgi:hypothetical protein